MIPNRAGIDRSLRFAAVLTAFLSAPMSARAAAADPPPSVRVLTDDTGSRLQVDGHDFMVLGMNWDYLPIGENYLYTLWNQPDDVIEAALEREMPLLKSMGVNAIRHYVGMPPRWVQYIYEHYGIYTVINHPCGRYGFTLDGVWLPSVDYSDPRLREAVTREVVDLVREFQGTPGVLMWLLGNENNYGLSWTSMEIEALPEGERDAARARYLYSLFDEITVAIKEVDPDHPVAIANGDVQYIDLIAQECKHLDLLGTNVYRGISARDLFQVVHDKLGIPVLLTEFGSDAFNAKEMREDQRMQARYLIGQWEEIYEQSSGKGRVGNAVGGFVFQWADGWWKFGQESRLDIHDTNASWPNGGYIEDYVPGENNMNEEWWGICAKGPPDSHGLYEVYPRAAYYALRQAFSLDPYAAGTDLAAIRAHFGAIHPAEAALEARGDHAAMISDAMSRVRLTGLRVEMETYSTGGIRTSTPGSDSPAASFPSFRGFDHLESFFTDFEAKPADNVSADLSLSVVGNVPKNPIDQIFYENRGRESALEDGDQEPQNLERVKVYSASVRWEDRLFLLEGYYRTGHTHWGYEGDFFGLYREAYYGENVDIYNGEAPVGLVMNARQKLRGLTLAFGPQLWWGANPTLLAKYDRRIGSVDATAMYQEDIARESVVTTSFAIPPPRTRKAALSLFTRRGALGIQVGGIWAGSPLIDRTFNIAEKRYGGYTLLQDRVRGTDTWGGKVKLTWEKGRWHWYGEGAYQGLVADGGPTATVTYTGWTLKDSGSGNQSNVLTGLAVNVGNFQIGPNFLWQKPLVGPVPAASSVDDSSYFGSPRDILHDPFVVRANRETVGGELVLCHDPTPATWMWAWDNDAREDAALAWSLGLVFRHLPTTQDAAIAILDTGKPAPLNETSSPPRDLWEAKFRLVSRLRSDARLVAHAFAGTGEPNGPDPRLIHRYGVDARLAWNGFAFETFAKVNDWGPYDYHRDFNLTFPLQLMGDVSRTLGAPRWFGDPQTRIGVRALWRSLDKYSPRYCPSESRDPSGNLVCDPDAPGPDGSEWEVRTYLHVAM